MKSFFTCVDVTGYSDMHNYYEPTIYQVTGVVKSEHIQEECVVHPDSLRELNDVALLQIHFLRRTKGIVYATLDDKMASGDNILSLLQKVDLSNRTSAPDVQQVRFFDGKFEDLRKGVRPHPQFPPYGEYFRSLDVLRHRLEIQFRNLDSGDISEKFWPHQGFLLSGERHADYPGYLSHIGGFQEFPMF